MGLISNAISSAFQSLGESLMNFGDWCLKSSYKVWNGAGKIAITYARQDPADAKNAWATVTGDIFTTMVAVGASFAVLYFVLGWLNESIDIRTTFTVEAMFRFFVRAIIAFALVANSLAIAEGITRCATALVGTLSADVTIKEPDSFFDNIKDELNGGSDSGSGSSEKFVYVTDEFGNLTLVPESESPYEKSDTDNSGVSASSEDTAEGTLWLSYGLIALIGGLFGGAVIIVCAVEIVIAVMQRLFKMLLCIPFAPIAFAGFAGGREFSRSGEAWFRTYISYCLEAVVIVIAISISFSLFEDVTMFEEVGGAVGVILQIVETCMPMICTCACVKGADTVVRRCMGLG